MKIETKYNLEDEVYYIDQDRICKNTIIRVIIEGHKDYDIFYLLDNDRIRDYQACELFKEKEDLFNHIDTTI